MEIIHNSTQLDRYINEAVKVCEAISKKFNHKIVWSEGIVGADAIDKVGNPYPDETHIKCLNSDAVLFGAIGDPKFDKESIPIMGSNPKIFAICPVICAIFANSFDDGSTLIVVSVKNSGPDLVNIRFAAATRLTPLFFGIVSNIGLTTDL